MQGTRQTRFLHIWIYLLDNRVDKEVKKVIPDNAKCHAENKTELCDTE